MRRLRQLSFPILITAALLSACSSGSDNGGAPTGSAGATPSGGAGNGASGGSSSAAGSAQGGTTLASGGGGQGNPNSSAGGGNIAGSSNLGGGGSLGAAGTSAGTGGASPSGGSTANGGSTATGGNGGSGTTGPSEPSGLPLPPTNNVAKPSGTAGNLKVLDWAGFDSAVSFTFDDALSSQIQNYNALNGTGVHLTFYLVSNNNGASATWSQAAKDGHELGNHTAHHCHDDGSGCAWGAYAGSLGSELDQCTMHVEQQFGVSDVYTAAAPYGDAGYDTPDSTRFLLNRGVNGGSVGANDSSNPFQLPCHTAAQGETAAQFNAATDAAHSAKKWQIFLIHSLGGDGGYNPVSITDVTAAINHAKSAGNIWADSMVHVGAYWRAQKLFSTLTPTKSGTTQTWTWTLPQHFPPGRYLRVKVDGGTLSQKGTTLAWSSHGYYEVALDAGTLTLTP